MTERDVSEITVMLFRSGSLKGVLLLSGFPLSGKVRENFIFLESQGKSGNLKASLWEKLQYLESASFGYKQLCESQGKFASKSQGKSGNFVRACEWEPCLIHSMTHKIKPSSPPTVSGETCLYIRIKHVKPSKP